MIFLKFHLYVYHRKGGSLVHVNHMRGFEHMVIPRLSRPMGTDLALLETDFVALGLVKLNLLGATLISV